MVTLVLHPEYVINDLPGFEGLWFTESSTEYLGLPASVAYATERTAVLQSAREAWAFRISSNGNLGSDKYQSTRTVALGVKIDGKYYVAIDDSPDTRNILLARAQGGYNAHANQGKWLVAKNDPIIESMLDRAQHTGRIFPALEQTMQLSTSGKVSAYGASLIIQAILGHDLAQTVATYLRERNLSNGYVCTLSPTELENLGVDDNHVEVRRVGVGGGDCNIVSLDAGDLCSSSGRARGVARKTPSETTVSTLECPLRSTE